MALFRYPAVSQREKCMCTINKLHCAINMLHLTALEASFFSPHDLGSTTCWKTHISSLYYLNGLVDLLLDDKDNFIAPTQLFILKTNLSCFYTQSFKIFLNVSILISPNCGLGRIWPKSCFIDLLYLQAALLHAFFLMRSFWIHSDQERAV